ncbi:MULTISPECIES: FUSC family protein [Sphingobacterium]|uniref:FUSC family protein n=1 Tax=Sphingobacterium athyrii TaxID=2152717 RepID=A0A363NZL2_9SPHI|nr:MULTISPECIES: FUSC family protein [Sphingobacterium]PUV26177.1 FUSC family protein [Sphingobacterium athyrii]QIH32953.1 FUSC family protein [Sphingobacterium sp. DR205]
MKDRELNELTDQELLERKKQQKSNKLINAVLVGFCAGVLIYGIVNKGITIFTFLLLVMGAWAFMRWKKNDEALDDELKSRNLNKE